MTERGSLDWLGMHPGSRWFMGPGVLNDAVHFRFRTLSKATTAASAQDVLKPTCDQTWHHILQLLHPAGELSSLIRAFEHPSLSGNPVSLSPSPSHACQAYQECFALSRHFCSASHHFISTYFRQFELNAGNMHIYDNNYGVQTSSVPGLEGESSLGELPRTPEGSLSLV